jgi:MFS family permease
LLLLPMLGAMLVTSMVAGRVTTNSGRYKIFPIVGGVLMTVGLYLLSLMDTGTTRLTSGLYMAVVGAGMGCLMQITMLVAQNSVQMKDMGVASSSTTLFRTLGSSFGVAIMGALFNHRVQDTMAERGGELGSKVTEQSAQLDAKSLEKLPEAVREAYQYAVSAGTHSAFLLGAIVAVLSLAAAVFVKEVPLKGAGPQKAADDAAPAPLVEV